MMASFDLWLLEARRARLCSGSSLPPMRWGDGGGARPETSTKGELLDEVSDPRRICVGQPQRWVVPTAPLEEGEVR